MGYRKLEVNGTVYQYVIGKSFVKIRHQRKPIPLSECGYKMATGYGKDYMVTPATLKEYLTTGMVVQKEGVCKRHNKPEYWSTDPYLVEICNDHTPVFACDDCFHESAMDI